MKFLASLRKFKLALHWQILIGVLLGILFGILAPGYIGYTKWAGDLFLRGLKMVVIPLVFSALVMGVSSVGEAADLGRIAGKTFAWYLVTTLLACVLGLLLVNFFKPGMNVSLPLHETVTEIAGAEVSFIDQIIAIVPDNVFQAMAEGNMLPVIFFAILFGFFINSAPPKTHQLLGDIFNGIYEVMIAMTFLVIRFAPIGLFGVVSNMVGEQAGTGGLGTLFGSLGIYAAIIAGGCIIHGLVTIPGLFKILTRKNPFTFMKMMGTALLTAFTTASSAASLPIALQDIQEKAGVSRKIAGFSLPLGNTVNMNGTALFECITAIFIAQVYGIDLSLGQQMIVILTSLLAAVRSAGIPLAGLVMLAVVLRAVGLPLEGIGLVLVVQQPLDMIRTSVNVWSDMTGAAIVAHSEGEKLNF